MDKPVLSKQAFWDVDMDKIDYERNAARVVKKMIERGTTKDFGNVLNLFGFDAVKALALQCLWLSDISVNFAAHFLKLNHRF